MAKLTDEQVVHVIDTINLFDKKGDGNLPVECMTDCLRSLGLNPLELEVAKIVKEIIEYHHENRIDVEDFLPIYEHFLRKKKPTFQELCDGLKSLDPSSAKNGTIDAVDLRIALTTIGDKLTQNECSFILDQVRDSNNQIDIKQLVRLVTGTGDDDDGEEFCMPVAKPSKIHTAQIKIQSDGDEAVKKILDHDESEFK